MSSRHRRMNQSELNLLDFFLLYCMTLIMSSNWTLKFLIRCLLDCWPSSCWIGCCKTCNLACLTCSIVCFTCGSSNKHPLWLFKLGSRVGCHWDTPTSAWAWLWLYLNYPIPIPPNLILSCAYVNLRRAAPPLRHALSPSVGESCKVQRRIEKVELKQEEWGEIGEAGREIGRDRIESPRVWQERGQLGDSHCCI